MDGSKTPRGAALVPWVALLGLALVVLRWGLEQSDDSTPAVPASISPRPPDLGTEGTSALLYGRVTTNDGSHYEGRLRWGGDQEASWNDTFHGTKAKNPWVTHVPTELLAAESPSFELFGFEIGARGRRLDSKRPFLARFGDLARIERRRRTLRVTLKSGTVVDLDRFSAGDFDDGVRVWDPSHGVVDLGPRQIRTLELLPGRATDPAPSRLFGVVHTRRGTFSGQIGWDRDDLLGSDTLDGETEAGEVSLRFDGLRSITRESDSSVRAILLDDREVVLTDSPEVGEGNRGISVDDPRYGRISISWEIFERLDLGRRDGSLEDGSIEDSVLRDGGPIYDDFPPGRPLAGRVQTHSGRRLVGRIVFDLDESETTDTLDAPARGLDFTLIFERIASVLPQHDGDRESLAPSVVLRCGTVLELEAAGDLGEENAGLLVFVEGAQVPEYAPWAEVERIDFEPPSPTSTGAPPTSAPRSQELP